MRPHEVEDLVIGRFGVLEERRERRDGLPGTGRRGDEGRAARAPDLSDGSDDRLLSRSEPVGEERRGLRRGRCGARIERSSRSTASPFLKVRLETNLWSARAQP